MANVSFLNSVDEGKVQELLDQTQENAQYFSNMVATMVKQYSQDLDELMEDLNNVLTKDEMPATDTLERYYAELTNMIYFKGGQLEQLNVYNDMAKAAAKEIYNKSLLDASSDRDEKGKSKNTVAENQAMAELGSQYENVVSNVYDHAYKVVKQKIEAATEMVSTLKTIIRRRANEEYFDAQIAATKTIVDDDSINK